MRKLLLILFALTTLFGCTNKPIEPKELTFDERMLMLIQECISDYNTSIAADSIIYKIDTPQLPVSISSITQIESLKELEKRTDEHSNAVYIAELPIEQYSMVFHIYSECDSFWKCGEASFEIDTATIYPDNPTLVSTKKILDELLPQNRTVFDNLYGIGVDVEEEESSKYPGYHKVLNAANIENPKTIAEIKAYCEETFDYNFISQFYPAAFESESPIYIEDEDGLYCIINAPSITDAEIYSTSLIISSKETDSEILVDIVSSYGEIIDPQVKRIIITKSENGYRLGGLY